MQHLRDGDTHDVDSAAFYRNTLLLLDVSLTVNISKKPQKLLFSASASGGQGDVVVGVRALCEPVQPRGLAELDEAEPARVPPDGPPAQPRPAVRLPAQPDAAESCRQDVPHVGRGAFQMGIFLGCGMRGGGVRGSHIDKNKFDFLPWAQSTLDAQAQT